VTLDEAVDVIAREVIQVQSDPDQVGERWEDHPFIGESDWDLVVARVAELTPTVGPGEYDEAKKVLEARAVSELP
jgi:hypothetical protein